MNVREFKGYNGVLILTETGVVIKRGLRGMLLGGGMLRGDKTIPYSSIVAIQMKKAGLTAGYLQLTLAGGSEAKSGLMQSTTDENSINFYSSKNTIFEEAKTLLEERIGSRPILNSSFDELEKLAKLREKGIVSEEEFIEQKKKLLS